MLMCYNLRSRLCSSFLLLRSQRLLTLLAACLVRRSSPNSSIRLLVQIARPFLRAKMDLALTWVTSAESVQRCPKASREPSWWHQLQMNVALHARDLRKACCPSNRSSPGAHSGMLNCQNGAQITSVITINKLYVHYRNYI